METGITFPIFILPVLSPHSPMLFKAAYGEMDKIGGIQGTGKDASFDEPSKTNNNANQYQNTLLLAKRQTGDIASAVGQHRQHMRPVRIVSF